MSHLQQRLRYRLVTGPEGEEFSARVSALLDEGYELYGTPGLTHDGDRVVVAQAVVLPPYEAVRFRGTPPVSPVDPTVTAETRPDPALGDVPPGSVTFPGDGVG